MEKIDCGSHPQGREVISLGYTILAGAGNNYFGAHGEDEPFSEELVNARKNVRPVFLGKSVPEVIDLIVGCRQTLADLELRPEVRGGMVFDGYETVDYLRRKVQGIVESLPPPRYEEDGHFYSPIPSLEDIKRHAQKHLIGVRRSLAGIEMHEEIQEKLLHFMLAEYQNTPEFHEKKTPGHRYYYANNNFAYYDAFVLQSLIKYFKPKKIVETGSGFSSCVLLDTNELYCQGQIEIAHIEPYPELLHALLEGSPQRKNSIIGKRLQEVELDFFDSLSENDIFFVDTSHVSKVDSDVNHYLFEIFPRLPVGVVIHIHDIGLEFDYEIGDMLQGRAWNESYILRAFLMYNQAFRVIYWNPFMMHFYPHLINRQMPLCWQHPGGSIWLQKVG